MFKGMISLVTGGSSGLGKATVLRLAQNGAKVFILDKQGGNAEEYGKLKDNIIFSQGCVMSDSDVQNVTDMIRDKFGKLDVLVNCAGCAEPLKLYDFDNDRECPIDDFYKCLTVNVYGTFNVIRNACALFQQNDADDDGQRGVIINTTSALAGEGDIGQVALGASSAATSAMALPLCKDLGKAGIRCVTIALGAFDTPLTLHLKEKMPVFTHNQTEKSCFPSRLGKPEEFAHLVSSIIKIRMINAAVIKLDGMKLWDPLAI